MVVVDHTEVATRHTMQRVKDENDEDEQKECEWSYRFERML